MTYPIANLVWGVPQTKEILDIEIPSGVPGLENEAGSPVIDVDDLLYGEIDQGGLGFEGLYSASSDMDDTAGFFGVSLWYGPYWELTTEKVIEASTSEALAAAKTDFTAMRRALPEWFSVLLPEPGFHIVWSDS